MICARRRGPRGRPTTRAFNSPSPRRSCQSFHHVADRVSISYAQDNEWLAERGVMLDQSMVYRWVQRFLACLVNWPASIAIVLVRTGAWTKPNARSPAARLGTWGNAMPAHQLWRNRRPRRHDRAWRPRLKACPTTPPASRPTRTRVWSRSVGVRSTFAFGSPRRDVHTTVPPEEVSFARIPRALWQSVRGDAARLRTVARAALRVRFGGGILSLHCTPSPALDRREWTHIGACAVPHRNSHHAAMLEC